MEEISAQEAAGFLKFFGNRYRPEELIQAEHRIMTSLDFKLVVVTALQLLHLYLDAVLLDDRQAILSKYYLDYAVTVHQMSCSCPKLTAAASIALAMLNTDASEEFIDRFIESTGLDTQEVFAATALIWEGLRVCKQEAKLLSIESKYSRYQRLNEQSQDSPPRGHFLDQPDN
jgi:hypothetical protein